MSIGLLTACVYDIYHLTFIKFLLSATGQVSRSSALDHSSLLSLLMQFGETDVETNVHCVGIADIDGQ
jgi:hypothetical protein